jgi:hydroxyethylthiazole kinase-like uncharacterized protein yjeF
MITAKEMRIIEDNAEELGLNRRLLMENAGSAIADFLKSKGIIENVVLVAGTGNKAGDGFVALRHILAYGGSCKIILLEKEENIKTQEARENFEFLKKMPSVKIYYSENLSDIDIANILKNANVVIDGLIGTGLKGKPSQKISRLIKLINESNRFVLAIDIPTGIDPDTGDNYGEYVKANVVITMHKIKKGLLRYLKEFEIIEANIGIPRELEMFAGIGDVKALFSVKSPYSKKGDSGRILIIGGSNIYHGAPILAGLAALRSGVDLVYLYLPEKIASIARSMAPEFIVIPYKEEEFNEKSAKEIIEFIEKVDAVLIGNGLGLGHDDAVEIIFNAVEEKKKFLIADADALKTNAVKKARKIKVVYTPHAGEFKAITGIELPPYEEMNKRIEIIKEASKKLGVIFLVKGHYDVISDGEKVKICRGGTQAMTVGGTGDVLAGLCTGLIARTKFAFEASIAASYINKKAGELATREYGNQIKATDLIEFIPKIIKNLDPTYQI